jgi:glycosyltransferase involved in cell wall biosynthesis
MKIAFIPGSCAPFHGQTLEERPLGGIETAVIRLAQALERLGNRVFVFTHIDAPPVTRPLYLPLRALGDLGSVDVLISVRELLPLFAGVAATSQFFWTGDSYNQLQHLGLGDRRTIKATNALLAVSNWQADRLCSVSGYPRDKVWILRNGHEAQLFTGTEERTPKRLIFSSTPYRGVEHFASIFPAIQNEHPDAELHIFSGLKVYEGTGSYTDSLEAQYKPVMAKLATIKGVTVHGNVLQRDLAREFMKSSILAYPNSFEETSCITAIEAMAAGCVVVTSRRGALPETIGDAGMFVDGDPKSSIYQAQFCRYICNLLHDRQAWSALHARALEHSHSTTWDSIAKQFIERVQVEILSRPGRLVSPSP